MALVAIRSGPVCESGSTQLGRVGDAVSCEWTEQVGGDRGTCRLVLPRDSSSVSLCAIFNVLRIVDDDGAVWEYRITGLTDGPTQETVVVEAVDLSHDLGRVRLSQTSGGLPLYSFAPGLLTATQYVDSYVLPALTAAGITWIVRGTITPTATYSLSWNRSTPLAVLTALEEATQSEFWLERDGDTQYKIMLGRRTASGTPVAFVGRNVETLERRIIADERFYNRAFPSGDTVSGELEPTHIGQHGWRIASVSTNDLTLANPNGGTGPIGCDDQLNGLTANVTFDGIVGPLLASSVLGSARQPLAYDPTRRVVWWIAYVASASSSAVLVWHDLTDGSRGTVAISGSTTLSSVIYVASRDEIWVSCNDASKVERITCSTKTSAGNLATSANPSLLRDLTSEGVGKVGVSFSNGAVGVELWDTTALTKSATLAAGAVNDHWIVYDSGSSRYFLGSYNGGSVFYYSSAYAYISQVTPFGGFGVTQPALNSGTLYVCKSGYLNVRSITCSTGAMGTDTAVTWSGGSVTFTSWYAQLGYFANRIWAQTVSGYRTYLMAFDPASSYAITTAIRVESYNGPIRYDATDDLFLAFDNGGATPLVTVYYRNGGTTPSGRLRFTVSDSVSATQVVTKPGGTLGPIVAEQLVEFREDSSDTYLAGLTDPASVATYGAVDGFPTFPDVYKRNYKLDPTFNRWTGNVPQTVGVGAGTTHSNATSAGSLKWDRSVAQASRSTTAQVNGNQALTAGVRTVNVKGLTAGRVVQTGTLIYRTTSAAIVFLVMAPATADGSGNAALTVYTNLAITVNDGDALTLHCPSTSDIANSYALALPSWGTTGSNVYPCTAYGAVHLPAISNATQAWIRLKFYCLAVGANASDLKVRFRGMGFYSGSGYTELAGASTAGGTAASPSAYALTFEQQVDMSSLPSGTDGYLSFYMPTISTWTMSSLIGLWLTAVEVYVATSASCPTPQGATPGDELTPWIGANTLLFTQGKSSPTVDYTVQFVEDGTAVRVGQTAMLRDPSLGIAASPRIVAVTRQLRRDAAEIARPIVQLNNRPLSAMEALSGVGA